MAEPYNVFISWSGDRSKAAAKALRDWLPVVLQAVRPWMSAEDIDKGSRGLDEVGKALEGMKIGIICLTPENLTEPWILYEAGALSKTLDTKTRLCTYLVTGLQPQDIKAPLGLFQHTGPHRDDTRRLLHAINKALDSPLSEANLDAAFDGQWPRLEAKLAALPPPEKYVKAGRTADEMIAEILDLTRAAAKERTVNQQFAELYQTVVGGLIELRQESARSLNALAHSGPLFGTASTTIGERLAAQIDAGARALAGAREANPPATEAETKRRSRMADALAKVRKSKPGND
jgi:hypothetical protein